MLVQRFDNFPIENASQAYPGVKLVAEWRIERNVLFIEDYGKSFINIFIILRIFLSI